MAIDPKIFELLRHPNAEERKRGVKALARTEDREALRYLATLYNQELDPEVRDLALKAGQHIKKRSELAKWGSDQGQDGGKFVDVEVNRENFSKAKSKLPTDAKTTQAKGMMDKAMDFVMQADYARAQDLAYQAFEIAPHIGDDPYYASVAAEVLGIPEKEAVKALKEGQPDYEVGKGKSQKKSKKASRAPLGVNAFVLDTVIIAGVTLAMEIMLRGFLQLPMNPLDILSTAGGSMLAIWVQFIMIHLAATSYLDGDGSFIDLFRDARLPLILQSFVYVAAFSYLSHTAPEILADTSAASEATLNTLMTFLGLVGLAYFGYGIWLSVVIGKTYGFNPFKGFLAILWGNGLTWCFYYMLSYAIALIFVV